MRWRGKDACSVRRQKRAGGATPWVFREYLGLTPGEACRMARFQAAVMLLYREPEEPLAHVALRAGYFDQPHFNREVRALAGLTPRALRSMPGFGFVQDATPADA